MTAHFFRALLSVIILVGLASCAGVENLSLRNIPLTGTVFTREAFSPSDKAELVVVLKRGDEEINRVTYARPNVRGTIYEVPYDRATLDPGQAYSVQAFLSEGGLASRPQPVLTLGAPEYADLRLEKLDLSVAPAKPPAAPANLPSSAEPPAAPNPKASEPSTPNARDIEFENQFGKAVRYACQDGSVLIAWFEQGGSFVDVERLGREALRLSRVNLQDFTYRNVSRSFSLAGRGNVIEWVQPNQKNVECKVTADRVPLRLSPGPFPSADLSKRDDWARRLREFWPAVSLCSQMEVEALPRITVAYAVNGNRVGARIVYGDGARAECLAPRAANSLPTITPLAQDAKPIEGEGRVIFTPVQGAYPEGSCYRTERVHDQGGEFIGWLSAWTCGT